MGKNNQNVIRDGATLHGYIAADENRLYGECRFKYRPMLSEETEELEYYRSSLREKPKDLVVKMCTAMADRIVAWSEVYENGDPVPVNKDAVRHLKYQLFLKMYRIISQQEASDDDPDNFPSSDEPVSLRELEKN